MIYYIEARKRREDGSRKWRAISWNMTDKEIADVECARLNSIDDVLEYIVTEKPS